VDKEPYSVKARFYKVPKASNPGNNVVNIELIYDMLPGWWLSMSKKNVNEEKLSGNLRNLKRSFKIDFKGTYKARLDSLWETFMAPVFAAASASVNSLPTGNTGETITARLWRGSDKSPDLFLLGSHPQGFYKTYILKTAANRLVQLKYSLNLTRDFPSRVPRNEIVPDGDLSRITNDKQYAVTTTTISKPYLKTAGNWPRIRTQNAVMGGVSANEVSDICLCTITHG
jgi:hypothetical protein